MFMIYGGGTEFQQWEQGKMLTNEHMAAGDRVVFRQGSGKAIPVTARTQDGNVVVDVPNELLTHHANIVVDLKHRPTCRTHFKVNKCACPDGYKPVQNIPDPEQKSMGCETFVFNLKRNTIITEENYWNAPTFEWLPVAEGTFERMKQHFVNGTGFVGIVRMMDITVKPSAGESRTIVISENAIAEYYAIPGSPISFIRIYNRNQDSEIYLVSGDRMLTYDELEKELGGV